MCNLTWTSACTCDAAQQLCTPVHGQELAGVRLYSTWHPLCTIGKKCLLILVATQGKDPFPEALIMGLGLRHELGLWYIVASFQQFLKKKLLPKHRVKQVLPLSEYAEHADGILLSGSNFELRSPLSTPPSPCSLYLHESFWVLMVRKIFFSLISHLPFLCCFFLMGGQPLFLTKPQKSKNSECKYNII